MGLRKPRTSSAREYVLPHRNDPEALKEPPKMYDFIELSDWQSFVISRLSEIGRKSMNSKRRGAINVDKKIVAKDEEEKLLKEKEEGLITISGYNDVLAMALGTPEHGGRGRGVAIDKKMMEEQQKKHEAAQELLQKQIEMLKVAISGQTCNVSNSPRIPNISHMSEKASTNIPLKFMEVAAGKEVCEDGCDDVVEQIEVEANKIANWLSAQRTILLQVAQLLTSMCLNSLLHNVPLGEENVRVSVNYALNGASPLPIPVKGVLNTVEDAVGSQVAWPEDLIVFLDDIVEKKKKTTKEKLAKSLFQSILETIPKSCKILYGFAQKLMSQGQTLASYIDEDVFGVEKMIYVLKEDVISFIQMNGIGHAFIDSMIMVNSYLYKLVKDQEWEPMIAFMDPSRTFHDPNSSDEARRVQYIVKALNQASIDSIFLISYNPGDHWILTIIDEEKDNVYIIGSLQSLASTHYVVGDNKGWTINFDYQAWARVKLFYVGDSLVFNYPGGVHNVVKVSRIGFHQCAPPLGSEPLTSRKDVIKLATAGRKWYICGVAMHCAVGGQKLAITVLPSSFASSPSPTPIHILEVLEQNKGMDEDKYYWDYWDGPGLNIGLLS
ncbi:unnamed protein product [Prunus armeniaca]|uniref:Phytocyanin domain-containing protein n=1 Tax=Prunus armeniaca TaxID=36596 RepID=A0A6J5UWC5_PRUAR|nr:unnamed protein product [Prunus armeniaca]